MFPFRKYAKHRHKVAILVVGSEGIVVGSAVFILDADRQIPRPHENEVCQEPPCPSIAVDERMDRLESDVKLCGDDKRMTPCRLQVSHPCLHHRCDHVGLWRRVNRSRYDDRDATIDAFIHRLVGKDERMELPDERFVDGLAGLDEILKKAKRIPVSCRFKMVFERLLANGHAGKHHRRFAEGERISFNGVRRIGVIDKKYIAQLLALTVCQRTLSGKPIFKCVNFRNASAQPDRNTQSAHRSSVAGLHGRLRDFPQLAVADSPFNLSVFAENTHPAVGYSPPLCRILARTIDYSVFTHAAQ